MNKKYGFLILGIISLMASGCNGNPPTNIQENHDNIVLKNVSPTSQSPTVTPITTTPTPNSLVFKNIKYGFELTFTDAWQGYKVEEGAPLDDPEVRRLDFVVPVPGSTLEYGSAQVPLYIFIQPKDAYLKALKDPFNYPNQADYGKYIGERNGNVYMAYITGNELLEPLLKSKNFATDKVIASFKFIK